MKKVVITGAFDGLHEGHRAILEFAKSLGSHLIVFIDSDERIRELKGAGRPVKHEQERKKALSRLECVHWVFVFDSDAELETMMRIEAPDVRVIGSDWRGKKTVGEQYCKEIVYFDRIPGISTTEIMNKKSEALIVDKAWGGEIIFAPKPDYCGKLLTFKAGGKNSMHYHLVKKESWWVHSGEFVFRWIETKTAEVKERRLVHGSVVHIEVGMPHQLEAITEAVIFEASTHDDPNDNYRVFPGDSQTSNS